MGRVLRLAEGGLVYHVLNRASSRRTIFEDRADHEAFERVLTEAVQRTKTRLLAYCVMPNHWHLVVWPREDGELSRFAAWLTLTHTQRWHAHRRSAGCGSIYQGRFKSFVAQDDYHLYAVCRYVERNALRANLVARAENWPWGSLHRRVYGSAARQALLAEWPIPLPSDWVDHVNTPQTDAELVALRESAKRGRPYGEAGWAERTARRLGLESTLRRRGRPPRVRKGV